MLGFASLVLLTALVAAAEASAATVSHRPPTCFRGQCNVGVITFRAAPGERNRLTVSRLGDVVELRDTGAALVARRGCTVVDAQAVRCPAGDVHAHLGDQDDEATGATVVSSVFHGGDGADVLRGVCDGHGGAGDDRIEHCSRGWGGAGDDHLISAPEGSQLTGGPGADELQGGVGDDLLHDASPERNRFHGGDGVDALSFRGRAVPVVVDLRSQTSTGGPIASIEHVEAGDAPDRVLGTDGPDLLQGGWGEDVVIGRAGDDRLAGGQGFDRFDAGAGDDVVYADSHEFDNLAWGLGVPGRLTYWDPEPEPVECGSGRDRVERLVGDLVAPDCERLNERVTPTPRRLRGGWSWTIPCTNRFRSLGRCRGTVTLTSGTVGHGGRIASPQRRRFDVRGRRGRVVFPYLPDDVFEVRLHVSINRGRGDPVLIRWRLDADRVRRR